MLNKKKIMSFTDLDAWKYGHKLVLQIYNITSDFPEHERFGLVSQLRRAAVSIASNSAEGFSRRSYREKIQFYSVSQGSTTEVQNQLLISKDLQYVNQGIFNNLAEQTVVIHKLISGLIKSSHKYIHNS